MSPVYPFQNSEGGGDDYKWLKSSITFPGSKEWHRLRAHRTGCVHLSREDARESWVRCRACQSGSPLCQGPTGRGSGSKFSVCLGLWGTQTSRRTPTALPENRLRRTRSVLRRVLPRITTIFYPDFDQPVLLWDRFRSRNTESQERRLDVPACLWKHGSCEKLAWHWLTGPV